MTTTASPAVEHENGAIVAVPDATLVDLVLDQARRRPDALAVRQWDRRVSYGELCAKATALAARLAELGVGPETRVGVHHRRDPDLVVALLGILLAGGAYVPLDPAQPRERLRTMVADAGISVMVADAPEAVADCQVVLLDGLRPAAAFPCPAIPDNAAYVLYTSGTTGRPKGVVMPHRSVVSLVTTFGPATGAGDGSVTLAFAALSFDVSVLDLFAALANGGAIALTGDADRTDPVRLQRFAEAHRPTRANLPVALLGLLAPERLPSLRFLLTGAEAPNPAEVPRWAGPAEGPHRTFLNLYGPTETCVNVTEFVAAGEWTRPLPIGRPQPNHRVHVVDHQLRRVPPGTPGELLVGGVGVARGYLGDPALTAARFIPDPFGDVPGARLYRTGDLVTWLPDGQLMFLGRTDRQVKIRGVRVEIGELETTLGAHPSTGHCVVDGVDGGHGLELVAYVTPGTEPPDALALRRHCADRLPAAMVPARVHVLESLPLTASGKVDLAALRTVTTNQATTESGNGAAAAPARGSVEQTLAALWRDLLGGAPEGATDFFSSGGHSLTAMRLVAALRAQLDRDVAVEDVLAGRTFAGIVARVTAAPVISGADGWHGTAPALSAAQRRLWFLDRVAPGSSAYNIAMAERLHGPVDIVALRTALRAVATRQEVLRWRIPDTDGVPRVEIDPPGDVGLTVFDIRHLPVNSRDDALAERLAAAARVPFNLAIGPLWRVVLYRLGPVEHVLAVTAHHAVFDGWSQDLLYRDLAEAYATASAGRPAELAPLRGTFADYVAWREDRRLRRADGDLDWWVAHLRTTPTTVDIPADRPRPAEQTFGGAAVRRDLDHETTAAVERLGGDLGATGSAVLLAALSLVLRRITGRTELVVGTPAVDRRHLDFLDMIGFFVEVVPLRVTVADDVTFAGQVAAVWDELLAALAHPEAPLDRIVDALGAGGTTDRNPVVQVLFNMFNFMAPRLELEGLVAEPVPVAVPGSPFDLTVYAVTRDGRIGIDVVYNPDLFDADRMATFADAYVAVLSSLVAEPATVLRSVTVPDEQRLATPGYEPEKRVAPDEAGTDDPEPRTDTERAIAQVWCEVLGLPSVPATIQFFRVGGTSMALPAVQQALRRRLGKTPALVELFRYPTVRALAAHLDGTADGLDSAVRERAARRGAARRNRSHRRQSTIDPGGDQ